MILLNSFKGCFNCGVSKGSFNKHDCNFDVTNINCCRTFWTKGILTRNTNFFEVWSWCKFNNLGLTQGVALKFFISMAKVWKLKVRKLWGLILTFVEIMGWKPVEGLLANPSSIGLIQFLFLFFLIGNGLSNS